MANHLKQFVKDVKKLSRQLDSGKGLMVKKTFDTTASIYSGGHENKPLMTIRANGDYKISMLKLLMIVLFTAAVFGAALMFIRGIKHSRSLKLRRPPVPPRVPRFDDDLDIPL